MKYSHPYFIGIKGAGMVGLATLFHNEKISVRGSDVQEVFFSDHILQELGILVDSFDDALPGNTDVVIYSAAYGSLHPQRMQATKRNIPQLSYFEAVGEYVRNKETIVVIGTHGKTSTTAILGYLMTSLGLDPTVLVGSSLKEFGDRTARSGTSKYFVVEGCEYKNNFYNISPTYILCTNIGYDHVDFFPSKAVYREAFEVYMNRVPGDHVISHFSCKLSFGTSYGEIGDISYTVVSNKGKNYVIDLHMEGQVLKYSVPVFGKHMVDNFVGALTLARKLCELPLEAFYLETKAAISKYTGTTRRMESWGEYNGAQLFDDYGHHPTEIERTLMGIKEAFPEKKIHIVFQSHTYTRSEVLAKEFSQSLSLADRVYIAPIYSSAREKATYTNEEFFDVIQKKNKNAFYGAFDEISEELKKSADNTSIICTMGAGDVWRVLELLTE